MNSKMSLIPLSPYLGPPSPPTTSQAGIGGEEKNRHQQFYY
jgi:hypothetical protein